MKDSSRRSGPKSRTSCYLGVTQYKRTGRWEAHIWVPVKNGMKGHQVHLGSFSNAEAAALAYDRAATRLKIGTVDGLNLHSKDYSQDEFLHRTSHLDQQAFILELRKLGQTESRSSTGVVIRKHRRKPGYRNEGHNAVFAAMSSNTVHVNPIRFDMQSYDNIPLHILELHALSSNKPTDL